jgi:hypothetical protein
LYCAGTLKCASSWLLLAHRDKMCFSRSGAHLRREALQGGNCCNIRWPTSSTVRGCTIGGANCGLVRCYMCSGHYLKRTDGPCTGRTARHLSIIATCFFLDLFCLGCVRSSIIELETLETVLGTGQKQCSSNCQYISIAQGTFKLWRFDVPFLKISFRSFNCLDANCTNNIIVYTRTALFCDITQHIVVIPYRQVVPKRRQLYAT